MTCLYPITAWRAKRLNENGKRPVVFRRQDGWEETEMQVPCGKCIGCKADHALAWSIRCYQESTLHDQNSFITLTYNDENLPEKLNKEHLRKFIKDLRSLGFKIRYYAVGAHMIVTGKRNK